VRQAQQEPPRPEGQQEQQVQPEQQALPELQTQAQPALQRWPALEGQMRWPEPGEGKQERQEQRVLQGSKERQERRSYREQEA
jgi:hypothetical protein